MNNILEITFADILLTWSAYLWPNRKSVIETHSAMIHLNHVYDVGNFLLPSWYHGFYIDGELAGVNSGHICTDKSIRSRGLWVYPKFRQQGIGKRLLVATIEKGRDYNPTSAWSYPRKSSWPTYESAGFKLTSDWEESETSEANAYCYLKL